MPIDVNVINRLISTLNQSKVQASNPALYQCIQQLIQATQQNVSALNDDTNNLTTQITNNSIGGISELTGDVTAGPGSGSQAATIGTVTSWTPVIKFGGGTTGIAYTTQTGHYYKIGKVVVIFAHIVLSNKGSSTGAATLTGLPFTVASELGVFLMPFFANMLSMKSFTGKAAVGSTIVDLYEDGATDSAALAETNFTNTTELVAGGIYLTS